MANKELEGIEKEMYMPDVKAPEGENQTTGAVSGEGIPEDEPEQQTTDAEKSEGKTQTAGKDSREGTADNDSGKQTTDTEESKNAAQMNGTGEGNGGSKPEREKTTSVFDIYVGLAQILASIAAVVAAVLAFSTLQEMQTERNNAYHPEIVISPNAFEGGGISEDEAPLNGKYFYINYKTDYIDLCYSAEPSEYTDCLYLEIPYLTLKNIGQGTAKDIQITFPMDWIESAVAELSEIENADYSIRKTKSKSGTQVISLLQRLESGYSKDIFLADAEDLVKKITYIASDETSVNVEIPECWIKMLAILYGRTIRKKTSGGYYDTIKATIDIPDPVIHLEYSDMQGNPQEDNIVVPWTGHCTYYKSSYILDSDDEESTQLRTGFYEDYIE